MPCIYEGTSGMAGQKEVMIYLTKDVDDRMLSLAFDAYPEEICGLLLGDRERDRIDTLYVAENAVKGAKAGDSFQIDPAELYRLERRAELEGLDVMGVYHSHPDGIAVPSREDEEYMIPGMIYFIISVTEERRGYAKPWQVQSVVSVSVIEKEASVL